MTAVRAPIRSLRTAQLEVDVLPGAGAKVISLRSRVSANEWLWVDPDRPLSPRPATGPFDAHELSGWDECFPTIGPCPYPDGAFAGRQLGDHGELWQRGWRDVSASDDEIALTIDGQALPYRFTRVISAGAGGGLTISYEVRNRGEAPFAAMWSMHPLFRAEPGMRIELAGRPEITKEFGYGGRLGPYDGPDGTGGRGAILRWPVVSGQRGRSDLRLIDYTDPPVTDKVVVRGLASGRARLVQPAIGETLVLRWDAKALPFLGICANLGAWPFDGRPQRWIALEPSTGGTDRLDDAWRRSESPVFAARATARWAVHVDLEPVNGATQ